MVWRVINAMSWITADHYFTQIIKIAISPMVAAYRDAVAGLALIHQIKGRNAEAWKMVESISQFDLEQSGSEDDRTRSLRARLMLLQGDLEGAGRWVDTFSGSTARPTHHLAGRTPGDPGAGAAGQRKECDSQLAMQILDVLDEIARADP